MRYELSVIMSVYNEQLSWIRESVNSILTQTFREFEFIIIVDNPQIDEECRNYLNNIAKTDIRIRLIYNEVNMGLPRCLNRALSVASGKYIARMDADDISFSNRFERELTYMYENNADVVSCGYISIDEAGRRFPEMDELSSLHDSKMYLPITNIFVHPSIIMKAEAVNAVGGYRDFRTPQDYDLWLRLLSAGFNLMVMDERLLYYRYRKNSISSQKRIEQFYAAKYQRKLFRERKKQGVDSFSKENYKRYIDSKRINEKRIGLFLKAINEIRLMKSERSNKITHFAKAMCYYPEYVYTKLWIRGNIYVRKKQGYK